MPMRLSQRPGHPGQALRRIFLPATAHNAEGYVAADPFARGESVTPRELRDFERLAAAGTRAR